MKRLLLCAISLLLLLSCELSDGEEKGNIYLVSASLDYRGTSVNALLCPNEDQMAVIDQFAYLSELMGKNFYSYSLTQDGESIYERSVTRSSDGSSTNRKEDFELTNFKLRLKKILHKVSNMTNPEDLVVFYYAGHGINAFSSSDEEARYLNGAMVLGNITFPDIGDWRIEDSNRKVLYPLPEFRIEMGTIPGRKLIILDSCYSGEIVEDEINEDELLPMLQGLMNPRRIYMDNIWELSGSRYDEQSFEEFYDEGVYHGRFTEALLRKLGYRYGEEEGPGEPDSGIITVYSLYESISKRVDDRDQTPDTSRSFVDTVIFRHPGSVRIL